MRVRIIGDRTRLDADIQESIRALEEDSKDRQGLNFQVALNYGGRDEIVRAVRRLAGDVKDGKLETDAMTENTIRSYLDTADIPDPDLLIRTSGEFRLSNFLMWQSAYTEFYFTDVLWPDFTKEDLQKAVEYYNSRERRFGGE